MLQNDLFYFSPILTEANTSKTTIEINAAHQIFDGHFPDNPVVPGVCMMQMVKEFLENIIEARIRLTKASNLKFLAILDPNINTIVNLDLTYTISDNDIKVDAVIYKEATVFFKFKGIFIRNENV